MERHMRDVLEDEVVYDHAQFGLLNSQEDDGSSTTPVLMESKHKPRRRKWGKLLRTAALCGAYISLGLCYSVTGPTLLFLKDQVEVSMTEISYIFTARSLGTLGGAFIGGAVLDKCNPYSTFFTIVASMGISIGAMPWFKHLWALMASSAVVGIGNGFLDTGASTLCLQLWGKDSGPYMQSLHFAFALGGSIAPLLVEAFVLETTVPNQTLSSRHARSITESIYFNASDINNITQASIIQSATQAPSLAFNGTGDNVTLPPIVASTANISSVIGANSTVKMLNQTTLPIEKPKKPKPSITNGGVLGDSSQFENIPLVNEPVQPDPPPTTSTTSQTPPETTTTALNSTSPTTQQAPNATFPIASSINTTESVSGSNQTSGLTPDQSDKTAVDPSINQPTSAIDSSKVVEQTNRIKVESPPSAEEPGSSSQNSSITHSDESTANANLVPSTTTQKSTDANLTSNSKENGSHVEEGISGSSVKPIELTTTTTKPSTSETTSTTTVSTATSTATTTPVPTSTTTQPPAKAEAGSPATSISQNTVGPSLSITTTSTESSATKSRGKNRGQQEEISLAIPTKAPTEPAPTTSEGNVVKNNHPNVVVDYLERFGVTRMHMLYTVIAIIVLHTSFAFLFFLCSSAAYTASLNADRHAADRKVRPFRPKTRLIFVSLMFLFYMLYVGSEVVFSQYLAPFTLENRSLGSSTSTANYVTTTFWAAFAIGRFSAIFIANFFSPTLMLYFNLGLTVLGALILCAAAQTSLTLLYVGSALVGFGMAPTFATGFVWTEMHLVVTNRISAVFSMGSSMGEMLFPAVTGSLIEEHPMTLMYEVLGSILLCVVILVAAGYLANYKSKRSADNSSGYHLACQTEELSQN